ncbi:MAG: hypothetical protein ACI9UV_002805 [Algoriphagus sp.]|jgi:hypothetical protein
MNQSKGRILIVILGQARASRLTWDSFKINVLDELNADLALCIGESPENNLENPYWAHAKYRWVLPEYEDFGDGFDQIQKNRTGKVNDWREVLKIKDQWLGGIKGKEEHPGSAGILVYFKAKLFEFLNSEEIRSLYDRFVITRSDFIWEMPHPKMDRLRKDRIWIPYGEFYWGVTDRHVVLSQSFLEPYLNLIDPILTNPKELMKEMVLFNPRSNWNHEQYILFRLKSQNLSSKISWLPYMMFSVREDSTSTSWSIGVYDSNMGLFIKYPTERIRTKLTKRFLMNRKKEVILLPKFLMAFALKMLFSLKVRNYI